MWHKSARMLASPCFLAVWRCCWSFARSGPDQRHIKVWRIWCIHTHTHTWCQLVWLCRSNINNFTGWHVVSSNITNMQYETCLLKSWSPSTPAFRFWRNCHTATYTTMWLIIIAISSIICTYEDFRESRHHALNLFRFPQVWFLWKKKICKQLTCLSGFLMIPGSQMSCIKAPMVCLKGRVSYAGGYAVLPPIDKGLTFSMIGILTYWESIWTNLPQKCFSM